MTGLVNKPSILRATRESEQLFILKADGAFGGLVVKLCPTKPPKDYYRQLYANKMDKLEDTWTNP